MEEKDCCFFGDSQMSGDELCEIDDMNCRPGPDDFDDYRTLKGKRVAQWKQDAGFGRGRHRPR